MMVVVSMGSGQGSSGHVKIGRVWYLPSCTMGSEMCAPRMGVGDVMLFDPYESTVFLMGFITS